MLQITSQTVLFVCSFFRLFSEMLIFLWFMLSLFIYLATLGLSCGMWALVPSPGIEPWPPVLGAWSLRHWTIREIPLRTWIYSLNPSIQTKEERAIIITRNPTIFGSYFCLCYFNLDHKCIGFEEIMKESQSLH